MGARSEDPTPGGRVRVAVWSYEAPECGRSLNGWLAGAYWGHQTHYRGGTRPCRAAVSRGALRCPLCESGEQSVWRCWVPWYSREYQRRLCLVSEDYLPTLKEVRPGHQIRISRAVSSRASCCVESAVWRTAPLHDAALATIPVPILPSLWRIWNDQELLAWHQKDADPVPDPVKPAKIAKYPIEDIPAGRDAGEVEMEKIANRLKGRFKTSDIAASIGGDPDHKPHGNGKPKPK